MARPRAGGREPHRPLAAEPLQTKRVAAERVELQDIDTRIMKVRVRGKAGSEFISHAWDQKVKDGIRAKHMHEEPVAKGAKDPQADFRASLYWMDEHGRSIKPMSKIPRGQRFGIPSLAFKKAMEVSVERNCGISRKAVSQNVHVLHRLTPIVRGKPQIREDMTRLAGGGVGGKGVPDVRFRAEFPEWEAELTIEYNAAMISPVQILKVLQKAGYGVGVGDWRVERGGSSGRFEIVPSKAAE